MKSVFISLSALALIPPATPAPAAEKPWVAPARAAAKQNPIDPTPAALAAGRKAYEKECLSCHGPTGKGDGPKSGELKVRPQDLSPQMAEQTDGALFWKLNTGRSPMPKFDELLTEEQRWQVIHYVRSFAAAANGKTPAATK